MTQLELRFNPPIQVDVDGLTDRGGRIRYIGKATKTIFGTWRCLADVEGSCCLVEVTIEGVH